MSSDSDSSSVVSCCDTSSLSSKSSNCYSKCSASTSNSKYSINSKWSKMRELTFFHRKINRNSQVFVSDKKYFRSY